MSGLGRACVKTCTDKKGVLFSAWVAVDLLCPLKTHIKRPSERRDQIQSRIPGIVCACVSSRGEQISKGSFYSDVFTRPRPQPGIFRGQVAASREGNRPHRSPSFASESGELRVRCGARSSQPKGKEQSSAVAVNRSLTRASLNSKLVNGGAPELFPVTLCLKSRLFPREGRAPRPRREGK